VKVIPENSHALKAASTALTAFVQSGEHPVVSTL
jgi:hypothetical protein